MDITTNCKTSLGNEETIARAVQFFSTEKWRATSQSARTVTFQGIIKIPWFMMLVTVAAFAACILPGIIMYIAVIKKMRRFVNLVVTANPVEGGSEVTITHPQAASNLVRRYIEALP
jgi:hypothetical protein